jgi:predicted ATPase
VQAILAARIDRLPSDEKDLLQTLAVIGREFPLALVGRLLSTSADELNRMLSDLQLAEFIYEQPAVGDVEYTFKHALTQEVAYNSLLAERRKLLHERTGQALESMFAEQLDDHLGQLAHHYNPLVARLGSQSVEFNSMPDSGSEGPLTCVGAVGILSPKKGCLAGQIRECR